MTKEIKDKPTASTSQRFSNEIARIMIEYVDNVRRAEYRRRRRKEREAKIIEKLTN